MPGDKSDDAAPENVPDEGALQEKEEAERQEPDLFWQCFAEHFRPKMMA